VEKSRHYKMTDSVSRASSASAPMFINHIFPNGIGSKKLISKHKGIVENLGPEVSSKASIE